MEHVSSGNSFKISYLGLQLLLLENVGDQHGWEIKGKSESG